MNLSSAQSTNIEEVSRPLPANRRILLIRNPVAGSARQRRCDAVLTHLREAGCQVELCLTEKPGDAGRFAARIASGATDLVAVAGGDGTINEVVNALAGKPLPLALVPMGTANVLAHELELDLDPAHIAKTIVTGQPRPVCLGRIVSGDQSRFFTLMAGAGFDAHVVAEVDLRLKRRMGKVAYVHEMIRQLFRFEFPDYEVRIDGAVTKAASVIVANAHFYGGRYVLAPHARLDAPELHVCLFRSGGRLAALRYAAALQLGHIQALADFEIIPAREVAISAPLGEPLQADGDLVGRLPVKITEVPNALQLILPLA